MQPTREAFEALAETMASAVVLGAAVTVVLAASAVAVVAALHWLRHRRGSTRAPEALFVGRWGDLGPELYLVGTSVRRLHGSQEYYRHASLGQPPPAALAFARRMLAEVMRCRPATHLARAFADAQLEPVPPDGFVLSKSDVEAWLETQ